MKQLDDSDENFSGKLKKFNLIGIPFQILIGKNPDKNKVEFKEVGSDSKMLSLEAVSYTHLTLPTSDLV